MVDVTYTTSELGQSALVVVTCALLRRDSWSFLEQGQNMATEALLSLYLEQSTC